MPKLKPETIVKRAAIKATKQVTNKIEEAIKKLDLIISNTQTKDSK